MSFAVRPLTAADAEASRQLGYEAFGFPDDAYAGPASIASPGLTYFGVFAPRPGADGEMLAARVVDRVYDSCFGGVTVPTSGIAGVTVAAEHRGQAALSPLFAATLRSARGRGALISTLFPTAPRIYRRFGYEVVAEYVTVEVPSWVLASASRPAETRTRRATAADFDDVRAVYDGWAVEQNGPLTRRGVSFPVDGQGFVDSFTGVTLAVDAAGAVVGYASWTRGQHCGEHAFLEVSDLLALTADGYRALLNAIGSFGSVTPTIRLKTSGNDLARLCLPSPHWTVVESWPYMLAILDVPGAFGARRYPGAMTADLAFALAGSFLPEVDGAWQLKISDGVAVCSQVPTADRVFTPAGLALLYAGTQSCANLRAAGHLTGGEPEQDPDWDALCGGRQAHIRDYF